MVARWSQFGVECTAEFLGELGFAGETHQLIIVAQGSVGLVGCVDGMTLFGCLAQVAHGGFG